MIPDRQDELAALHQEFIRRPDPAPRTSAPLPAATALSVNEVIERALAAANGAEFAALYHGDMSAYGGDHSVADLAITTKAAFYNPDRAVIDGVMRQSGLYREKWERADYRERTIDKALQRSTFYSPPTPRPASPVVTPAPNRMDDAQPHGRVEACGAERARIAELETQLLAAQSQIDQLQRDVAHLKEERHLILDALRNPDPSTRRLVPTMLAVGFEHESAVALGLIQANEPVRTSRPALSAKTGRNEGTISTDLSELERRGFIQREVTRVPKGSPDPVTGEIRETDISILKVMPARATFDVLREMAAAAPSPAPNRTTWGGAHARCSQHPTAGVIIRRTTSCAECGRVLDQHKEFRPAGVKASELESQDAISETAPEETPVSASSVVEVLPGGETRFQAETPVVEASQDPESKMPFQPIALSERLVDALTAGAKDVGELATATHALPRDVRIELERLVIEQRVKRWADGMYSIPLPASKPWKPLATMYAMTAPPAGGGADD